MRCFACNEEIDQNTKFCKKCGQIVPRCPTCGVLITRRAKFCTRDGTAIPQEMLDILLDDSHQEPVQTPRFCVRCGKPTATGEKVCRECQMAKYYDGNQKPAKKPIPVWIWAVVAAVILLIGAIATGYYLISNDIIELPFGEVSIFDREEEKKDSWDRDEEEEDSIKVKETEAEAATEEAAEMEAPEAETTAPAETAAATEAPATEAPATEAVTEEENPLAQYEVGDYLTFGTYEQDNNHNNGPEGIQWLVLDKQEDRMLVISKYALDSLRYNTSSNTVTWANCTMRTWLNGTFYKEAFSKAEQAQILTSLVTADMNTQYNTNAGKDTEDKVFLLSLAEVLWYLPSNEARFCVPTSFALRQDIYTNTSGGCWWLMRTPGNAGNKVTSTNSDGSVDYEGGLVNAYRGGVRPAMWIDIS